MGLLVTCLLCLSPISPSSGPSPVDITASHTKSPPGWGPLPAEPTHSRCKGGHGSLGGSLTCQGSAGWTSNLEQGGACVLKEAGPLAPREEEWV